MMGGGVCWLDYDRDGWLDLYVVNSYAQADASAGRLRAGCRAAPSTATYGPVRGRQRRLGRRPAVRGNGCVAADFDLDGHTDLFVTTAGYNVATDGYDALLWGHGDGTFTEGAARPGSTAGLALRRGRRRRKRRRPPDLFVAGYTDVNAPIPGSSGGFPTNFTGRARPPLPQPGPDGRAARVPGGRPAGRPRARHGSTTGSAPSSPTSTRTAGSTSTSQTTSTRTGST